MMECQIYQYEISHIIFLQKNLQSYSKFFLFTYDILNPTIFFNFLLPLLSGLDKDIFLKTTISGLVADYLNCLLKWFLAEPRPHWWIHEDGGKRIRLRQFEGTCECTPGSFSSETMVTAAIFFVLISNLLDRYQQRMTKCCKNLLWMSYSIILVLQMISQVFLGVHFLHQSVFGAIAGIMIGSIFSTQRIMDKVVKMSKFKCFLLIFGMFLSICGGYLTQLYLGVDPNWSTILAFRYCENAKAIQPESLIMYSLLRNLGIFIGILAFSPLNACRPCINDPCLSSCWTIPKIFLGLLSFHNLPHHQGVYIFYGSTVGFYAIYYFILYYVFTLKSREKFAP